MWKDHLRLHFVVFLWGFTAILGKLITLSAIEVVFYRTLLAALALMGLIIFLKNKQNESIKVRGLKLGFSHLPAHVVLRFIAIGVIVGLHWIFFFAAAKVSKISVCLAGMSTCSLFTAFLEPMILKTRLKYYEVLLGMLVIVGLYIILHFEYDHAIGLVLALISAALASLFSVLNSRVAKAYNGVVITFWEMVGACITSAVFIPIYQWFFLGEGSSLQLFPVSVDWLYLLVLSVVCTVFAFYEALVLLRRLSAYFINLITNLEPVYGIILAVLIFGEKEKMADGFYFGTSVILFAVLIYPVLDRHLKNKPMRLFRS